MWGLSMAFLGGGALYAYLRKTEYDRINNMLSAPFDLSELNRALLIPDEEAKKAVFQKSETQADHEEQIRDAHRIVSAEIGRIVKLLEQNSKIKDAIVKTCARNASRLACALCIIDNARTKENIEARYRQAVCIYYEEAIEEVTFARTFATELPGIQSVLSAYDCSQQESM